MHNGFGRHFFDRPPHQLIIMRSHLTGGEGKARRKSNFVTIPNILPSSTTGACPVCHLVHHVNPATGAVLGEKVETVSVASVRGLVEISDRDSGGEKTASHTFAPRKTASISSVRSLAVRRLSAGLR
jgi:hypothetical protein